MKTMVLAKDEDGFTIVEIIIALVVGLILMLGLAVMVNNIRIINARAQDAILINSLAEDKIEELRSQGFSSLGDGTVDFTDDLPASITKNRSATYQVATVTGNIALKEITLSISHNDYGSSVSYFYKTYIGELGVGQY